MALTLEHLTINLKPSTWRYETLEGRKHRVVPAAMITEGVHAGSDGPILYRSNHLGKRPGVWNHKPIVVYHPMLNGRPASACDPQVLENQKVGILLNTKYDDKLRTECWVDEEKCRTVDSRILDAIDKGEMMELSTGVWVDNEGGPGKWTDGKNYNYEATNLGPDHLALLPDKVGACSIADGAGFLRINEAQRKDPEQVKKLFDLGIVNALVNMGIKVNEMSFSNIRMMLCGAVKEKFGKPGEEWYGWVEDVYPSFFIFYSGGKLYRQGYSATDTKVTLSGDPEEVVRVTEYRTLSGKYVGNESPSKEIDMDRKQRVDGLIGNGADGWSETDREYLTKMPAAQFDKLFPLTTNAGTGTKPPQTPTPPSPSPTPPPNPTPTGPAPKPLTANEALDQLRSVSPEMAEMFSEGLVARDATKKELVGNILKNPNCAFTEAQLNSMPLGSIQAIAKMAIPAQAPTANIFGGHPQFVPPQQPAASYQGAQGAPIGNTAGAQIEGPLDVPVWNESGGEDEAPTRGKTREPAAVGTK